MHRTLLRSALVFLTAAALAAPARPAGRPGRQQAAAQGPAELLSEEWPQRCPRLYGGPDDWLNTDGKPVTIQRDGKHVYLIDFWEYTCVNCLRTLPYLAEWNKRYAPYGLVIVGIHTPEFEFARDHANVAAAAKRLNVTWPVLIDSDYKNWNAFHNNFWPRKYFVDGRGMIVADHSGEGDYEESEARIQQLLLQIHPNLKLPRALAPIRDTDMPGAVCYPMTAETYVGGRGHLQGQHGNINAFVPGKSFLFIDPGSPHADGKVFAEGMWTTEPESLRHARATEDLNDYIALRYHAIECNAVIKPEGGKPFRVYITQDTRPIAAADRGDDIKVDDDGATYVEVDAPRMYKLIKNAKFGSHELKLASRSADFGLYSFTFTSCQVK